MLYYPKTKILPGGFENDRWYKNRLAKYRLECSNKFFESGDIDTGRIWAKAACCSTQGILTGIAMFILSFIHAKLIHVPFVIHRLIEKRIKTNLYKVVRDTYSLGKEL